jgi:hypothetical protein
MYFAPFPFLLRAFTLERPSSLVLYKQGTSFADKNSGQRAVRWDKTVFAIEQLLDFYIPICRGERAISLSEGGVVAIAVVRDGAPVRQRLQSSELSFLLANANLHQLIANPEEPNIFDLAASIANGNPLGPGHILWPFKR